MRTNDSSTSRWLLALALGAALTLTGFAQTRDRATVPDKYKWNLADIYPTDAAWRAEKDAHREGRADARSSSRASWHLASVLADALEQASSIDKTMSRLYVYASMLADQDTRDAAHQACSRR